MIADDAFTVCRLRIRGLALRAAGLRSAIQQAVCAPADHRKCLESLRCWPW